MPPLPGLYPQPHLSVSAKACSSCGCVSSSSSPSCMALKGKAPRGASTSGAPPSRQAGLSSSRCMQHGHMSLQACGSHMLSACCSAANRHARSNPSEPSSASSSADLDALHDGERGRAARPHSDVEGRGKVQQAAGVGAQLDGAAVTGAGAAAGAEPKGLARHAAAAGAQACTMHVVPLPAVADIACIIAQLLSALLNSSRTSQPWQLVAGADGGVGHAAVQPRQ